MATLDYQTINVSGCEMNLGRAAGAPTGAPVLLLHGAGGAGSLGDLAEKLAADHDVILPDHPGFGSSAAPDWIDNISDVAFLYLDLLEQLGLSGVHVLGHSMGGWIAAEIAIRSTHRLASLTLVSSAGIHVKGVPKGDVFIWSPEERVRNLFVNEDLIAAALALEPSEEEIEIMVRNRMTAAKYCWSPRFYNPDLHKWLHRIDIPALIVWGDADTLFPADYAAALGELIPKSRVEIMAKCGHMPFAEHPEAFRAQFSDFIGEMAQ